MNDLLAPPVSHGLLAVVRDARAREDQAARDTFFAAADYLAAHAVGSRMDAAALERDVIGHGRLDSSGRVQVEGTWEQAVPLTGEGAPLVAEAAVVEFTAALGYSTAGGRAFLADVAETRWRLPHLWARLQDGSLPVWRARRIAQATRGLAAEVAAYVDRQVAPLAHRVGLRQVERLAREAAAVCEPDIAAAEAEETIDRREVVIETDPTLFYTIIPGAEQGDAAAAVGTIYATLDTADARDLEQAVAGIAHGLLDHDTTQDLPLGARRAAALGVLARGYLTGTTPTPSTGAAPGAGRTVELLIHTDTPDLAGTGLVRLGATRGLSTIEQLDRWATAPGVTVKPVIVVDLNEEILTDAYRPTPRQRRQAMLIHATCAFPHCGVKAEHCDLDHRVPYGQGGKTTTSNLTPLCRRHHRAKTHLRWRYERVGPGTYLWESPGGYRYLTSPDGTIDLTADTSQARPRAA
jgi:hypothetical protein